MSKKLILVAGVAGVGYLYASQNGLLFPGEDDEFQDDDEFDADPEDLNINNPLALFAISLATQAGLKAASKAVKRVAAPKTTPPSNITPAKAGASSEKPAVPSKTPAVTEPPAKPKPAVATASTPPTKPTTSGTKPATPATNAAAAQPPAKPPTAAAKSAAKAGNASKMMTKLKGTPADLIVMVIAQILMAVLDLDPSKFMDCETGEFDLGKLPDWAQAMIGAIPFLGDLFDLIGNKMCLRAGCPRDAPDESAGLCYKPCDPGFKSDGAIMCYKQYPEFESNGMGHTITSITKKILMDTGKIPSRCGDGEVKSGALCYENVEGFTNLLGVAWQNCPAGFTDTGVRCEKLHDVGAGRIPGLNPCPPGEHDDGISCWRTTGQVCGDDCSKGWDGCRRRGLFGECWGGCRESCSPVRVISRTAFDRGQYTAPHEDKIDGLNYNKCPEGMSHQPGMPYLCTASFTKQSRVMAPRSMKCERKAKAGIAAGAVEWEEETNIAGLCYGDIPKGYSRKVIGTLDQDCPPGSTDFGVGCIRQAYNRGVGLIPLGIRFKDRLP
jgi:hypothetical protein